MRAFLLWWHREAEPDDWINPLAKAKPPKVILEPIEGVDMDHIKAMLNTCGDTFTGYRDRAIILCLLDTGARAREFLSLNLDNVDAIGGAVILCKTKNKEPRVVFIGRKARRASRAYLKKRNDNSPALWATSIGERLAMSSLQGMLQQRGKMAGIKNPPSPHDFRRAFVLAMLRADPPVDLITLSRLTGHKTLEQLKKYAKQTTEDLRIAHEKASSVDRSFVMTAWKGKEIVLF